MSRDHEEERYSRASRAVTDAKARVAELTAAFRSDAAVEAGARALMERYGSHAFGWKPQCPAARAVLDAALATAGEPPSREHRPSGGDAMRTPAWEAYADKLEVQVAELTAERDALRGRPPT